MGNFDAGWLPSLAIYLVPLALLLWVYFRRSDARETQALRDFDRSRSAGLGEPVSVHPVINGNRCMGCGACADACPQGDVLGVIGGHAELVNPTNCIGHGACARSCPTDAIRLVIGTERRGVSVPILTPDFQTTVPGLFVAGELGGMGLIRNAIEQGRQAVEAIRKLDGMGTGDRLDLVIVGAGPAGFGASLTAVQHKMRSTTLEQDQLGGSIAHHPRGKIVVVHPVDVPMVGKVDMRETQKEELLEFWQRARREHRLPIRENEPVLAIEREGDGFIVKTPTGRYETRAVLLAVGRRGTPRKLEVPGEESSKVVYRLTDPNQYRGQHVLVVGGGDSALEAASSLSKTEGTKVTLSYRGSTFQRAGPRSHGLFDDAVASGRLNFLPQSTVRRIEGNEVELETQQGVKRLPNESVIVCCGGVMPGDFLQEIGVKIETRYGTPLNP